MKKMFEQPELMVVRVNKNDIVTASLNFAAGEATEADAAGRRMDNWDAGY